jgi:hypothetical protein
MRPPKASARPQDPCREYRGDAGYPTLADREGVDRRAFLRGALSGAATVAVAWVLGGDTAAAAPATGYQPPAREKVTIGLGYSLYVSGTSVRFFKVDVLSSDKAFARFLEAENRDGRLQPLLDQDLKGVPAETITDGRKILRLEQKVGAPWARHYTQKSRKPTSRPDVMLHVTEGYRGRTMGVMVRPSFPTHP